MRTLQSIVTSLSLCILALCHSSLVFAQMPICLDLQLDSSCKNGVWQIQPVLEGAPWQLMGADVGGKSCSTEDHVSAKWQYAFYFGATSGCNYVVQDQNNRNIGPVQLKSNRYIPWGKAWKALRYPGMRKCDESQDACRFMPR